MLFEGSDEDPGVAGLGVLPGQVRLLPEGVKRPQMQWNVVEPTRTGTLFDSGDRPWLYFLHSFHAVPDDASLVALDADHGIRLTAAIRKDNIFACQFHPEKSQSVGLQILRNFVERA